MSDDKTEMVTIEVPVELADWYSNRPNMPQAKASEMITICRKALAARKSLYERWREGIPVRTQRGKELRTSNTTVTCQYESEAKLLAAAPQLLKALIVAHKMLKGLGVIDGNQCEAICEALPEPVADEVLS